MADDVLLGDPLPRRIEILACCNRLTASEWRVSEARLRVRRPSDCAETENPGDIARVEDALRAVGFSSWIKPAPARQIFRPRANDLFVRRNRVGPND